MRSSHRRTKGNLVASALAGAWRATPSSELNITESQLDEITPLFCSSGGAGLGWWRVRTTRLSETPSGQVLRQAYRLQTLQSAIHEEKIQKVFRLLRTRIQHVRQAEPGRAATLDRLEKDLIRLYYTGEFQEYARRISDVPAM